MIKTVRLQNFRCFSDKTIELDPGVNLITGQNGIGKTTVLEAIYLVFNNSSWRGKDDNLIQHGKDWARVDVVTDKKTFTVTLDARQGRLTKKQLIDGELRKSNDVQTVLFEPEFILTFTTNPEKRRTWLDDLIEKIEPEFRRIRNNYKRALAQRNRLLKQNSFSSDAIFVWNLKLSEYGAQIAQFRNNMTAEIQEKISDYYSAISGKTNDLKNIYQHQFPIDSYSTAHLKKLEESIDKDRILGFTTSGPHREDIIFSIDNELFSETASRGEVRTLAMALKKIEIELLEDQEIVELYDDAFSELDSLRSSQLLKNEKNQTIVTSAEEVKLKHTNVLEI